MNVVIHPAINARIATSFMLLDLPGARPVNVAMFVPKAPGFAKPQSANVAIASDLSFNKL